MVANVDDSRDDEDEESAEDLEDDLLIYHLEDEIEEAPATNLHFIKRRKNSTSPLQLEVDSVSNKIVGLESKAFPRLVGREVALHVPGHHPSWANVPEQYDHLILTKLRHYYQLDSHPKLVAISIAEMAEKYKTRKNIRLQHLREYYKNPEDFENAVKNPPNELNEDQWRLICELFTTPDFIQRSKQNSINRQKMKFSSTRGSVTMAEILRQKQGKGYIETWKECHTKKDTNTFINEAAKNKYEEMLTTRNSAPESSQVSELEILRKTLGERRGHQQGVGRKLKGQSSGRRSQPATADQPDLRETVVELQKQIQTLTQQMSRERRELMDVEMNDAAPTQPIRPQPSRSQMGFNPMGFEQPHQTPTSFQQLLQQPLLQQPLVPSPGMLSPEQFHSQMYQSYLQFVFQSPKNSQVLLNMMTQSPQTSHIFNNDIVVIDNNINNDNLLYKDDDNKTRYDKNEILFAGELIDRCGKNVNSCLQISIPRKLDCDFDRMWNRDGREKN
ncbi:hypothetical protein G4B88_011081 [Cannabis sativa]|uniref:Uncharacterized protein n=1 Tax=Cannabis sativa TaxID=3483 RepID=A0A7J6FDD1_CANSA|nr:hypothetical protein G4B88_011081 [Cannabis sativa]